MADFKAKMHQIVCRLGLRPKPRWGSLQRSPRPPSWILGGLLIREGKGGKGRGEEGRGGEEKGGRGEAFPLHPPSRYILDKGLHTADGAKAQVMDGINVQDVHTITVSVLF